MIFSFPSQLLYLDQFSYSVMSDPLQLHELQHTRLPCPLTVPGACSSPCPSSQQRHQLSHHLLSPSPPAFRGFSSESVLHVRWPKYWSFSYSICPSNEYLGLISFRMDWLDLLAVQRTLRIFSNITVQKHQFFNAQASLCSNSHTHTWLLEKP